jgi:hypothetical protein
MAGAKHARVFRERFDDSSDDLVLVDPVFLIPDVELVPAHESDPQHDFGHAHAPYGRIVRSWLIGPAITGPINRDAAIAQLPPRSVPGPLANVPSPQVAWLSSFSRLSSPDEAVWFLSLDDYADSSTDAFAWNEFEILRAIANRPEPGIGLVEALLFGSR